MALQKFTTWPFLSADGTKRRTLPDRISDVQNIIENGAIGNGIANDRPAIQRAVNAAALAGGAVGGTVIVPPGRFSIDIPIVNNNPGTRVRIVGAQREACFIDGSSLTGYCFDNLGQAGMIDGAYELSFAGGSAGAIRMAGVNGGIIDHCVAPSGTIRYNLKGSTGVICKECQCAGPGGEVAGQYGYATGDDTQLINCNGLGLKIAVLASGSGLVIKGCRTESNDLSIALGLDDTLTPALLTGFSIRSHTTERNNTAFRVYNAKNGKIAGGLFQATLGVVGDQPISNATWSGSTATITSFSAHGFSSNQGVHIRNVRTAAAGTGAGYNGFYLLNVSSPTVFTVPIASNPGTALIFTNVSWSGGVVTIDTQSAHGLSPGNTVVIDQVNGDSPINPNAYNGTFTVASTPTSTRFTYNEALNPGNAFGYQSVWDRISPNSFEIAAGGRISDVILAGLNFNSAVYIADINLDQMTVGDSIVIQDTEASPAQGGNTLGQSLKLPSNNAAWPGVTLRGGDFNTMLPIHFASLPASPTQGDVYVLDDANIAGKNLGDPITAGGAAGKIEVWWNGTAWTMTGN